MQSSSETLPDQFYKILPMVDPKDVRLFLYKLWLRGLDLQKWKFSEVPKFLSNLENFPNETFLILLKYNFPTIIEGDLLFSGNDTVNDFILDLSRRIGMNLNHINSSTGETILHRAVREGNLAQVQKLLSHQVNPNVASVEDLTPIQLALKLYDNARDPVLPLIIRHLKRYGAVAPSRQKGEITPEIQRQLSAGEKMKPFYYPSPVNQAGLDRIEDLALILTEDPNLIQSLQDLSGVNLTQLSESIQREKEKSIQGLNWPFFINDTLDQNKVCPIEGDDRVTAAAPADNRQVYKMALATLRDISPYTLAATASIITPSVPPGQINQLNLELEQVTRPLATASVLPTSNPKLPFLV